jgi:hypothetical protein
MGEVNISGNRRANFAAILADVEVGTEVTYHVGEFAAGPHKSAAMEAEAKGACFVYQRKQSDGLFAYIAKKRLNSK